MKKIRAICFDLDGVYFTKHWKKAFEDVLCKKTWDDELVKNFLYKSEEMRDLCLGHLTEKQFFDRAKTKLWIEQTLWEFSSLRIKGYRVDDAVHSLISWLRKSWYLICSCTNNNGIRLDALVKKFNLDKVFDHITSSHRVHFFKPSVEIFASLLSDLWCEGAELVYADDNPERLTWAKNLWIKTFLYKDIEWYKNDLKESGVQR